MLTRCNKARFRGLLRCLLVSTRRTQVGSGGEADVAGQYVGVEAVFAGALFADGVADAAFGVAELVAGDVAEFYGEVDVGVVVGVGDLEGEVAAGEFQIFVAGDVGDGEVAAAHACVEIGGFGDGDGDDQFFFGDVGEREVDGFAGALEFDFDLIGLVDIFSVGV